MVTWSCTYCLVDVQLCRLENHQPVIVILVYSVYVRLAFAAVSIIAVVVAVDSSHACV